MRSFRLCHVFYSVSESWTDERICREESGCVNEWNAWTPGWCWTSGGYHRGSHPSHSWRTYGGHTGCLTSVCCVWTSPCTGWGWPPYAWMSSRPPGPQGTGHYLSHGGDWDFGLMSCGASLWDWTCGSWRLCGDSCPSVRTVHLLASACLYVIWRRSAHFLCCGMMRPRRKHCQLHSQSGPQQRSRGQRLPAYQSLCHWFQTSGPQTLKKGPQLRSTYPCPSLCSSSWPLCLLYLGPYCFSSCS